MRTCVRANMCSVGVVRGRDANVCSCADGSVGANVCSVGVSERVFVDGLMRGWRAFVRVRDG